ncbi:glycoside hydrolase superfamily [Crucibulum laeve]|uniref:Alpha-galactosidase n=1 Tax=Crucibulum laeve TaxID=68775 RepID=A0A5C3MHU1_9AGAR|nr:glycoside hydrolase superfamily [Crucibulum laeve]
MANAAAKDGQDPQLASQGITFAVLPFENRIDQLLVTPCLPGSASSSPSTTSTSGGGSTSVPSAPGGAPTTPPTTATGKLPALGWNSWNAYQGNINEAKVLAAANQFISLGLKDAGYQYINIDDCWANMARNSSSQRMVPDATKFPNGISGLASQIHALGLKIGIYSDAGTNTCAGYPGSLGYESIDASTFSEWGIDYLKYGEPNKSISPRNIADACYFLFIDNCNVPSNWTDNYNPPGGDWYNSNSAIRYRQMGAALATQSRPIQFSLCIWGNANVWDWGARVGHSWRMSGDSSATWSYITSIINTNVAHISAVKYGAHNDMDMMEIGNGALTVQEQRTHFAAWVFLKSPILLGTDLSKLSSAQLDIIKNKELLAFHQDATVGTPAIPFTPYSGAPTTSPQEYFSGTSSKGTHVFIINTSSSSATKQFIFSNVPGLGTSGSFKVHDMWSGSDLSGTYTASSSFSASVAAHDTVAYLVTKV